MPWFPDVLKTALRRAGEIAPSCKEAARLQSHALDRRLKPLEGFGLRFHLLFCKWCRAYGKQISFLSAAAKKRPETGEAAPSSEPALSPEARERIKRSLESGRK